MRNRSPLTPTQPKPGFYLLALVPGGWPTPCRIILEGDRYSCVIDGEPVPGSWTSEDLQPFWLEYLTAESVHPMVRLEMFGKPTDEATIAHRMAMKVWAAEHNPDHPCLHPRRRMKPSLLPSEF